MLQRTRNLKGSLNRIPGKGLGDRCTNCVHVESRFQLIPRFPGEGATRLF